MSSSRRVLAASKSGDHIYDRLERSGVNRKAELIHFNIYDRAIFSTTHDDNARILMIDEDGFETTPDCSFCSKAQLKRQASLKGI
jgi:hypothetical protein